MPASKKKTPAVKSLDQHCEEIAAAVGTAIKRKIDVEQVRAVLDCDKVTMPESHPVTGRILSELMERGLTPSKKE